MEGVNQHGAKGIEDLAGFDIVVYVDKFEHIAMGDGVVYNR
jgi:hypothetical protein